LFPKPRVVISKCLGFDHCRYNAEIIPDYFIDKLRAHVEFITVCPEVEIGLGTPRAPIRIVEKNAEQTLFQPETGHFFTGKMIEFTDSYLSSLTDIDGFILKNRSPSCGPADVKIFQGFDKSAAAYRGSGFFGGEVIKRFAQLAVEDEGRLKNFTIREHFLTKLFTRARFRLSKKEPNMAALVDFHSRHKLLLLAYNQAHYRISGRIVANHQKHPAAEVYRQYAEELSHILKSPPRFTSMINTVQHAFGWVSENLTREEKQFFLKSLENYRDERIPLSTLLHLIHAWAIRFKNEYLLSQILLAPYPQDLAEISDSGKGRNY
jgi:uncharacterized protein YbgA (DUF1722 family)/uncharacterized protein YbbK (DUF523 family)